MGGNMLRKQHVSISMRLSFILVLCLIAGSSFAASKAVQFPGKQIELRSPSGQYVLINRDYESGDFNHALFVRGPNGAERRVYTYDRHVTVLWSPASEFLVVNDRKSSDVGTAILITVSDGASIDLMEQVTKQPKGFTYDKYHHVFLTGERWLGKKALLLRLTGHGEAKPREFEHWYSYTVGGKTARMQKPSKSSK